MTRASLLITPATGHDSESTSGAGATVAVVILVLTQLMFVVDTSIVNVALPDIGRELGLSDTGLSWVVTAYALTFGGLILLSGKVGSMIGLCRALLLGVSVFVIASIAGGLATSAEILAAARALQGTGAALAAPSVMALLMGITDPGPQRSRDGCSSGPRYWRRRASASVSSRSFSASAELIRDRWLNACG
ncbi:MFS transporter [Micromonospora musae]|uniref:MFS transporter n=1 Tax=Micromonospora musae TaxID=1894970 RepID=UPI0033D88D55